MRAGSRRIFYDGEGLCACIKEDGKTSTFLFLNGEILAECDGNREPVRRHLSGLGLSHMEDSSTGILHTYHQDEQGSTACVTGRDRAVENCYVYDAFGNALEKKERIQNCIQYTGQQYDQETGQYYLRARYYNPAVGRFTQEDTYRGDGLNLYAYCKNNPVVYYDPSGHTQATQPTAEPESTLIAGEGAGIKDIYRAVSPEEYEDIMNTKSSRGRPDGRSYEAKQFGNDFNEILELANQPIMKDTAAIVKVTIPESIYNQLNHMPLDVRFLKSGAVTVEPNMLAAFNESIIDIEHVF